MAKACLDFNGVLADSTGALIEILKQDWGILVPRKNFGKHLIGQSFPNVIAGGCPKVLTKAIWEAAKDALFNTKEFLRIQPIKDALAALHTLQSAGWGIRIVTDARTVTRERIDAWLKSHGFEGKIDIILSRRRGSKEPYQSCCDVVVDNDLDKLTPLIGKEGPRLLHFLPPTGGCDSGITSFDPPILSLRGWPEVIGYLLGPDVELAA